MSTFQEFVFWAFCGLISFYGLAITSILAFMYLALKDLGEKVAVVISRTDNHETRLTKIEEKI